MDTELGRVTHDYKWVDGVYYRRLLGEKGNWEHWENGAWSKLFQGWGVAA